MYNTENIDICYRLVKIPKKSGAKRILEVPDESLKNLQKRILWDVLYKIGPHESAHGFVKNKSPKTNASVHRNAKIIIKLDIANFFSRTKPWTVKKKLLNSAKFVKLTEEEVAQIIDLTFLNGHLPTGAPTSPALGNICLFSTDIKISKYCEKRKLRYSRYADDITISSAGRLTKTEIIGIIRYVSRILKLKRHVLNHKKTKVFSNKQRMEVTGVVINNNLSISKKHRANIRAAIHQARNLDDIKRVEGRIAWVTQVAPSSGKKLSLALYRKRQDLQLPIS